MLNALSLNGRNTLTFRFSLHFTNTSILSPTTLRTSDFTIQCRRYLSCVYKDRKEKRNQKLVRSENLKNYFQGIQSSEARTNLSGWDRGYYYQVPESLKIFVRNKNRKNKFEGLLKFAWDGLSLPGNSVPKMIDICIRVKHFKTNMIIQIYQLSSQITTTSSTEYRTYTD